MMLKADAREIASRRAWRWRGDERPPFAREPGPGQESVWDYPRPPRIEPETREVEIRFGTQTLARTRSAVRVLETASPPTFYLPPSEVDTSGLEPSGARSFCEWKGEAVDLDLRGGPRSVGWCYPETFPEFASIAGWLAFYPAKLECFVDGERAAPQPGGYYGGWLTKEIVGPVKGEPGIDGL